MRVNTYLTFNGNCEEAVGFYTGRLGGKIERMWRFKETPMASQVPAGQEDKIIHASFTIGDTLVMASDGMGDCQTTASGFALSINTDTAEEAERLFAILADGGKVTMPLTPTFWATRFGMVNDRFGTPWMVNCEGAAEESSAGKETPQSVG